MPAPWSSRRAVKRIRRLSTILAPLAIGLPLAGAALADDAPTFAERWNGWVSSGGAWNSDTESFGEITVFGPLWQDDDSLFFGEVRGRIFEDDLLAGNAAIGVRQMTTSGFNLGAWVGLDVFRSQADNTFGQVSGGVEALSTYFDFRANGYLPFTDPQTAADGTAEVILTGPDALRRGEIFMIGGEEVAAHGADAEAGFRLPFGDNSGHLGVYGGGYWYDADELAESVTGGMARVELAFNDIIGPGSRLTGGYRYSDDNVNGDNHMVGVRLRIPFDGAPALAAQSQPWQRMIDPLERNPNIHIGRSGTREAVEDGYTEVRFDRVAYSDNNDDLDDDITLGANTLLVLDGATVSQKTLEPMQTLAGGGSLLRVRGVDSGAVSYASIPGSRPTISNANLDGYALTLGGYNTVNGVDVVSQRPDTGAISDVTLGGIDGSGGGAGLDVMAIVDTDVTVTMTGTGDDGAEVASGRGEDGENGITGSTLYGINFANADRVWIENTAVTATMSGHGGTGGVGGSSGSNTSGGNGGFGVLDSIFYGINLDGASNAWLNDTTVTATVTGDGGDGGNGGTSGNRVDGGAGRDGVDDVTLYGINLGGSSAAWLSGTTVTATMTGNGGNGGDGGDFGPATDGGGGGSGIGVDGGIIHGIDLGGSSGAWLSGTSVTATMTGNGGDGGDGVTANSAEGGNGDEGIDNGEMVLLNLSGSSDAMLSGTTVTATMTGNGGDGGDGGTGVSNGAGGDGGPGIEDTMLTGIGLGGAANASLNNTTVTATMTGNGGDGGDDGIGLAFSGREGGPGFEDTMLFGIDLGGAANASLNNTTVTATMTGNGGDGGNSGIFSGGDGGPGIEESTLIGINVDSATATLTDTTVNASMTGTGGDGGSPGGSGGAGFVEASPFNWIDPLPVPPGVTLNGPTTFLGAGKVGINGNNDGP